MRVRLTDVVQQQDLETNLKFRFFVLRVVGRGGMRRRVVSETAKK